MFLAEYIISVKASSCRKQSLHHCVDDGFIWYARMKSPNSDLSVVLNKMSKAVALCLTNYAPMLICLHFFFPENRMQGIQVIDVCSHGLFQCPITCQMCANGWLKARRQQEDAPGATQGKWMGCLQTAINWGWLVCHRLPISCSLLSLPEMEVAGRWREVCEKCLCCYGNIR